MNSDPSDREELARQAEAIYVRDIQPLVEPQHNGESLILNVDTGQFVMDPDPVVAAKRALREFPNARRFSFRVGFQYRYRLGDHGSVART